MILERGKIDGRQAIFLMINLLLPTSLLTLPLHAAVAAGQDAWISPLLASLASVLAAFMVTRLSARFPGKNLLDYPQLILGRVPGKIIAFLYVLWFIHIEILVFAEYGAWNIISILPETPVVTAFIIAPCLAAYLARNGLEVMSRVNQIFLPLVLFFFILVVVLASKDMSISYLLPVFDRGWNPIMRGAFLPLAWFGEGIALTMVITSLTQPQQAFRIASLAVLTVGCLTALGIMLPIAVLGPELTSKVAYPTFMAVRMISIANFLERMDSLMVVTWTIAGFIKIGLMRYLEALGAAQVFGLRDYRQLVLPLGVIISSGSLLMYGQSINTMEFLSRFTPPFYLTFEAVIPALLLAVAIVRRLGGRKAWSEESHS